MSTTEKDLLRQQIRKAKGGLDAHCLAMLSEPIVKRLLAHPRVEAAQTIMMYYSLADEVDTRQALDSLVSAGKTVLLPVVLTDSTMQLRRYTGASDLAQGAFHIMEPTGTPFNDYPTIDVAVVPGMAFDGEGNRLGRGKAYYDRFLPSIPQAYKIGVCFLFQKVERVPTEPTDIKMDEIL